MRGMGVVAQTEAQQCCMSRTSPYVHITSQEFGGTWETTEPCHEISDQALLDEPKWEMSF